MAQLSAGGGGPPTIFNLPMPLIVCMTLALSMVQLLSIFTIHSCEVITSIFSNMAVCTWAVQPKTYCRVKQSTMELAQCLTNHKNKLLMCQLLSLLFLKQILRSYWRPFHPLKSVQDMELISMRELWTMLAVNAQIQLHRSTCDIRTTT